MLTWIGRFLNSSIGKKFLMALTGLGLIVYLIIHLAGNLKLYGDETGAKFNEYATALGENPLLPLAEVALGIVFIVHIALGIRVSLANREARKKGYRVRNDLGRRTFASSSMLVTGIIVGIFLVIHVIDFRVPKLLEDDVDLAALVRQRLSAPLGAIVYLVGVAALTLHLFHAFGSSFQTLGLNHPKYNPLIWKIGFALAILLGLGFASFPIYLFATGGGTR